MHTDTDLLDRHLPPRSTLPSRPGEEEPPADYGAFGWLRGSHERAAMLELRKKDGSIIAYPYAWLFPAKFNPSDGITLRFGSEEVKIIGRNLNAEMRQGVRLFAGITRHRVPWIQEADEPSAMAAGKGAVVVESIRFNK